MASGLETQRLVLRRRTADDAALFHRLWSEREAHLVPPHRRLDADGRPTVDDLAAEIRAQEGDSLPALWVLTRRDTDEPIGYCGLVAGGGGRDGEPGFAFELVRSARGLGLGTEAGRAVLAWADTIHPRLWATVRVWNAASLRVLERLGFRETGEVEDDPTYGDSLLLVRDRPLER